VAHGLTGGRAGRARAATSLAALRFVTLFGVAGLPIFVGLAVCNERCRRFVRPRLYNTPNVPMWRCGSLAPAG
jgi:hypothetical protein